jgi:hypothetical protein
MMTESLMLCWREVEGGRPVRAVIGDPDSIFDVWFRLVRPMEISREMAVELWQIGPPVSLLERDGLSLPWWKTFAPRLTPKEAKNPAKPWPPASDVCDHLQAESSKDLMFRKGLTAWRCPACKSFWKERGGEFEFCPKSSKAWRENQLGTMEIDESDLC